MDSCQLHEALHTHPLTKSNFWGVFASDQLEYPTKLPASLIVNVEPSSKSGSHWISLYIAHNGDAIYFDSLAQPPLENASRLFRIVERNRTPVQSVFSSVCGELCMLFIFLKSAKVSFSDIIYYLRRLDDKQVKKVVESIFYSRKANM